MLRTKRLLRYVACISEGRMEKEGWLVGWLVGWSVARFQRNIGGYGASRKNANFSLRRRVVSMPDAM